MAGRCEPLVVASLSGFGLPGCRHGTDDATLTQARWMQGGHALVSQASLEALDSFGAMLLNSKISADPRRFSQTMPVESVTLLMTDGGALHRRCILGIAWDTARCGDALLGTDGVGEDWRPNQALPKLCYATRVALQDDLAALSTEETALCEVGAICIAAAIELQLAKGSAIGSAKSAVVPNEWLQWRVEACARAAHIAGLDSNKSEALRNIAASLLEPYRLGFEELHQQDELAALEVAQLRKELQAQEHQELSASLCAGLWERQQKLKRIKAGGLASTASVGSESISLARRLIMFFGIYFAFKIFMDPLWMNRRHLGLTVAQEIQEQRSGGDPELQAALDLELKDGEETEAQDKHGKAEADGKRASAASTAKDAKGAKDGEDTEAHDKHGKMEADGKRASAASTSKDAKGAKDAKDGEEKELRDKHGQKEADGKRASAASTANDTKGAKEAKDSKDGEEKETEDKNGKKEAGGKSTSAASTTKDAQGAKEAKDSKDGEEKETEDKNGKKEAGGKSTSAASTTRDAKGAKEAKESKDGEEKETEDKNGKKEAKSGGKAGVDKDKLAKTEVSEALSGGVRRGQHRLPEAAC
ncbi:unnamed protein product [Effrenium voratum]|nr:unnamed protein product [Effrenium voratum]